MGAIPPQSQYASQLLSIRWLLVATREQRLPIVMGSRDKSRVERIADSLELRGYRVQITAVARKTPNTTPAHTP